MAKFEQKITSFDLEQLRRAYERHLERFMVNALNRPETRPWTEEGEPPIYPFDFNPVITDYSSPPPGTEGAVSGVMESGV